MVAVIHFSCTSIVINCLGAGEVAIDPGLLEHRESLLAESRIVIQEGWWPAFFMIDKSRAEKNGIQRGRCSVAFNHFKSSV